MSQRSEWGGKSWGEYVNDAGHRVEMFRKGQKVRFFDSKGRQFGPEQRNVGPAIAAISAAGYYSPGMREFHHLAAAKGEFRDVSRRSRQPRSNPVRRSTRAKRNPKSTTEHFTYYRGKEGEVEELRVSKPSGVARLYRVETDDPVMIYITQDEYGRWSYSRSPETKQEYKMGSREELFRYIMIEGYGKQAVEKVRHAIARNDYRIVRGQREFFPIEIGRRKDSLEVIDLGDGRWTVLWAGLEYGPAESLDKAVSKRVATIVRGMERKGQYEEITSVSDVLGEHYR